MKMVMLWLMLGYHRVSPLETMVKCFFGPLHGEYMRVYHGGGIRSASHIGKLRLPLIISGSINTLPSQRSRAAEVGFEPARPVPVPTGAWPCRRPLGFAVETIVEMYDWLVV